MGLLVLSSCSALAQNPGSRNTFSGFHIIEGKRGGVLIRRQRCLLRAGKELWTSLQYKPVFCSKPSTTQAYVAMEQSKIKDKRHQICKTVSTW